MSSAFQRYGYRALLAAAVAGWVTLSGPGAPHMLTMMGIVTLASVVSGIAGFAFSALCGGLMFHLSDDPVRIVQVMMTCSIANQAAMTWSARADIDWRSLPPYLAGGALGLIPGVWVLLHVDRVVYTHALGLFLTIYGIFMLVRRPIVIQRPASVVDFAAGFLSGVTGGAAAFPSAFVSIWCGMKGWDKRRQRAILQPFILILQVAAWLTIALAPQAEAAGPRFDVGTLLFIPASLFGTSVGLALYRRLNDSQFGRAVNILLVFSGLSYVA